MYTRQIASINKLNKLLKITQFPVEWLTREPRLLLAWWRVTGDRDGSDRARKLRLWHTARDRTQVQPLQLHANVQLDDRPMSTNTSYCFLICKNEANVAFTLR